MELEQAIRERRSVRKYEQREIPQAVLEEIVELARFSPSWKNTQVPRYHVVTNGEMKQAVADHCVLGFAFNAKTISRCPALAVVTAVKGLSGYEPDGSFSTTQEDRWEIFDTGVAVQTFCLAAHAKGVGTVILGVFDEEKIRQYVPIPQEERVVCLVAMGYPLEAPKAAPPRKEVAELLTVLP